MEKQILEIIKQKDEFKYSIEISNANQKGFKQVTVKVRSDAPDAHTEAQKIYNELTGETQEPKKEEASE
jgi:hypothetical protein